MKISLNLCIIWLCIFNTWSGFSQCILQQNEIVLVSDQDEISYEYLVHHLAPMLWFSPDEPKLYDEDKKIQLPQALPFDRTAQRPVVYYSIRSIYSTEKSVHHSKEYIPPAYIQLAHTKAIDIDYLFYYREESGIGSHPHDIETASFQLTVIPDSKCDQHRYALAVKQVTGRAHGLAWFDNTLIIDDQMSFFPISILVEEGKHASCTDKNADGSYTPGYDVNIRVNDAWGVRDIISSGNLFTGAYQAWMAKSRNIRSLLFPPIPKGSKQERQLIEKFGDKIYHNVYELRPYIQDKNLVASDKKLQHLIHDNKRSQWPKLAKVRGDGSVKQWIKEERAFRSFGVSYRFDNEQTLSFSFPLLIFKNVAAPMTGGWFYNKLYLGSGDSYDGYTNNLLGHQIVHTTSASRWLDSYIGFGYEITDVNQAEEEVDFDFRFVSEAGLKLRLNITKTPLKFFRHLGTDYWGVKFGWKNVGFKSFSYSGFVVEIGAGVF